jgi:hypothetical protein
MGTPGNKGRKLGGHAAVLAIAPAIREALAAGVHLVAVYEQHAAQLGISYVQFTKHVRRHIAGEDGGDRRHGKKKPPLAEAAASRQTPDRHASGEGSSSPGAPKSAAPGPRTLGPRKLPEFHYDPMDAYRHRIPKREE